MAKRSEIENARPTVEGLTRVAEELGYPDLDYFLEDNPGAIEAIYEWVLEYGKDRDLDDLEEDEEEEG